MNTEQRAREWLDRYGRNDLFGYESATEIITALLAERQALLDARSSLVVYRETCPEIPRET